ncbi:hypothetical protein EJ02DRAFT_55531 [Clathrospora elynae]|uniref:F-box domain-containing protein n=1 Tax=Clathrospora elynae TaxID=706981 RepID=A0A6A5SCY4_9PLEO|nr:hypothetical protein EJ02DRAFT_55531 [Clathrospora elynae]
MEKILHIEELVEHIVSEVTRPLPSRHNVSYSDLLSLTMVSNIFRRITKPYLYRSLVISPAIQEQLLRTMRALPELSEHIQAIFLARYPEPMGQLMCFVWRLPNLRTLDIDFSSSELVDLAPVLKRLSITALRLSSVEALHGEEDRADEWAFTNNSIQTLDISFTQPHEVWEECYEFGRFAAVFRNLENLRIHSTGDEWPCTLNAPVFRCLVHAFRNAFQSTLRDFSFQYNDYTHASTYDGDESLSDTFDARGLIKESHLEHLKVETNSLLRPMPSHTLRSLEIGISCLPSSLHTLYLRHEVDCGTLTPRENNLMYSEEAQCLSQLIKLTGRKSRFLGLQKVTLAVCLPVWFEEVAIRVIKVHARRAQVQLDVIFMSWFDYTSEDTFKSWPEYDIARDPRHPSYDPMTLRRRRDG